MVKPADDMLQPLDAMPWLPRARKLVCFIGETHHYCGNLAEFQRAKHLLTASTGRCPIVGFAENKHHRGLDVVYVTDRRSGPIIVRFFEWRRLKPVRLEQCKIPRIPPVLPTGDVALSNGCSKTARLPHHPVRQ